MPDLSDQATKAEARRLLEEGRRLLAEGEPGRAIALLQKAVELDPENHEARFVLGQACLALGRLMDAVREFQWIISHRAPKDELRIEAMHLYAWCHLQMGHKTQAQTLWAKLLEVEPDHVPALDNLGLLLLGKDQVEEGMELLRKAAALQPDLIRQWREDESMRLYRDLPEVKELLSAT